MTQYLLALYRDYAAPIPAAETRQVWADVNALGENLTAAGAFVFQGGMDGSPESATVVRQSGGEPLLMRRSPRREWSGEGGIAGGENAAGSAPA